jgi:predicted N-formylglutamate amidohydrolase
VSSAPLLGAGDPAPVSVVRDEGRANIVLIGDHAGSAVPVSLGDLGVSAADRRRHIALDLGVQGLGEEVAARLDAVFVSQRFSRLVIDCNRDPREPRAILEASDGTAVPGNAGLDAAGREARVAAIHEPYQDRIAQAMRERRARAVKEPVLVALHSFTPVLGGRARPWQLGVLYDKGDTRLSQAMIARLRREADLVVGDNEPYKMDGTDHTIPRHAYPSGTPYLEIEFRQDLLETPAARALWAERFTACLRDAIAAAGGG